MNTRGQDALLGLLFFSTLTALGVMTIVLSDFRLGVKTHNIELYSDDVGFLRPGDPVLVFGMTSGKVKRLERLTTPVAVPLADGTTIPATVRVHVLFELDLFASLRPDFEITVEDRGVLGGKLIRVEMGEAPGNVPLDALLYLEAKPGVLEAAGDILEENRDDLRATINNLSQITEKANTGSGPLGVLLSDEALAQSISDLFTNLADLSQDLKDGKGTLGKLFTEDSLHDMLETVMTDIQEVTAGVAAGEGTLGKLLSDDTMYEDASSMFADLREVAADLAAGEGTAGRLLEDPSLYDNANDMITEIRDTVSGVSSGDGLLAMLINDAALADKFGRAIDQLLGAVEDARETTPVQSLGSFLFGTF